MKMNSTRKIGTVAAALACAACVDAMAASTVIRDFLDDTISLVPNQFDVSLFERVTYTDNVKNSPKDRIDSVHFDTGLGIEAYRNKGDLSYGVSGEVSYDYYTRRSSDMNGWDWNITPFIKASGLSDIHNLKLSLNMYGKIEPLSNSDLRYSRHYTTEALATYDYARHEHWGFMLNGGYKYDYYPQDEFEDYSKHTFTGSFVPYYRFNDDVKTGMRLQIEKTAYDSNRVRSDSYKQTYNLFVDYRMNSFLEAYAEGGIEKRSYSGKARGSNGDRDWNWDFLAALRYSPTIRLKFELKSQFDIEDSTSGKSYGGGAAYVWDNSIAATWKPEAKYDFTAKAGIESQNEVNSDDDTTEYYVLFRASYRFNEHLNVYAQYKYDKVDFKYGYRKPGEWPANVLSSRGFTSDPDYYENEVTVGVSYRF